jgi:hypothetical protein
MKWTEGTEEDKNLLTPNWTNQNSHGKINLHNVIFDQEKA